MQIALFSDEKTINLMPRDFGLCCSKKCVIQDKNINKVKKTLRDMRIPNCTIEILLDKERHYKNFFGMPIDSHFLIEMMGVTTTSKRFIYIISIEDCLDSILAVISGCKAENVRKMRDYDSISKALLTLDVENMDISMGNFLGLDENLDSYINSIEESDEGGFLKYFYSCILSYSAEVLKYIGFFMQYNLDGVSMKSMRNGKIILASDSLLDLDGVIAYTPSDESFNLTIENKGVEG